MHKEEVEEEIKVKENEEILNIRKGLDEFEMEEAEKKTKADAR